MKSTTSRFAPACVLALLATASAAGFAQPPPVNTDGLPLLPGAQGEPWTVMTLYEFYGARDRRPSRRDRTQNLLCAVPGTFSFASAANAALPDEYKDRCWVGSKRAEPHREQIKFVCNDGMTAEAVTRREADGSFASKFVINLPEKGAMSITRTFRKAPGVCDVTKVLPEVPVPPPKPSAPAK